METSAENGPDLATRPGMTCYKRSCCVAVLYKVQGNGEIRVFLPFNGICLNYRKVLIPWRADAGQAARALL